MYVRHREERLRSLEQKLQGEGVLAANDISNSRAKGLLKNIEVFGIGNSSCF